MFQKELAMRMNVIKVKAIFGIVEDFSELAAVCYVSAGQLCDLRTRPLHVVSRTAIYGFSMIADDATALG